MKPEQVAFDTQLEDMRNDYQVKARGSGLGLGVRVPQSLALTPNRDDPNPDDPNPEDPSPRPTPHPHQDAMQGGSGASGLASAYADRALYRIAFLPSALEAASRKISLTELDSFA